MSQPTAEAVFSLPTQKIAPRTKNARKLLFYSKPKAGKTTVLAGLDDCLIIDLEGGTDFLHAMKVDGSSFDKLQQINQALIESQHKYKYIAIDPISRLEDIVLQHAGDIYRSLAIGQGFPPGDDVTTLPNGAGYRFLRMAFFKVLNAIGQHTDRLILSAHLREKMIEKNGKEVSAADIDLTGKIRSLICADVDAIAFLERTGTDAYLNFQASDEVICGARPSHLKNQRLLISRLDVESDVVTTFWDQIYIK